MLYDPGAGFDTFVSAKVKDATAGEVHPALRPAVPLHKPACPGRVRPGVLGRRHSDVLLQHVTPPLPPATR